MMDTIRLLADTARAHGLRPVVHPHAGGYLEFRDEIERVLDDTDVELCLDTGHLAYAGMSAQHALEAYAPRLAHLHLKDVRGDVLQRVRDERVGFWDALADLRASLAVLAAAASVA
jgi:inosose dehydratase